MVIPRIANAALASIEQAKKFDALSTSIVKYLVVELTLYNKRKDPSRSFGEVAGYEFQPHSIVVCDSKLKTTSVVNAFCIVFR